MCFNFANIFGDGTPLITLCNVSLFYFDHKKTDRTSNLEPNKKRVPLFWELSSVLLEYY